MYFELKLYCLSVKVFTSLLVKLYFFITSLILFYFFELFWTEISCVFFLFLFYLYIYPPDWQKSNGGVNT